MKILRLLEPHFSPSFLPFFLPFFPSTHPFFDARPLPRRVSYLPLPRPFGPRGQPVTCLSATFPKTQAAATASHLPAPWPRHRAY